MRTSLVLLLSLAGFLPLQPQDSKDKCSVSLVDIAEARKVAERGDDSEGLVKVIGRFDAEVGEEVLTTKHFLIPGTKDYVTASVFYSDEDMAPLRKPGSDVWHDATIRLGIFISNQRPESAFAKENNAVAQANYADDTVKVSVIKSAKVNGKLYSVAMECICNGAVERRN